MEITSTGQNVNSDSRFPQEGAAGCGGVIKVISFDGGAFLYPNKTAQDRRLSLAARGLLTELASRPHNWKTSVAELSSGNDLSPPTIRNLLNELIAFGYCKRWQSRDPGGRQGATNYVICLDPAKLETMGVNHCDRAQENRVAVKPRSGEFSTTYKRKTTNKRKDNISVGSSAATPDEPRLTARADDMPSHVKPVSDWGQAMGAMRRDPIRLEGDQIVLDGPAHTTWLERFGGDAESLNLALIEARGCIQPNARAHPLAVQVEKQLARMVRDRKDRDARYAKTAAGRRGKHDGPRKPTVSEILEQRRLAAAGGVA